MKGSTLSAGYIVGNNSFTANTVQHLYVGATVATPVAGLNFGAAFDYQETTSPVGLSPSVDSVIAIYGSYAASAKLKLNVRGEMAEGNSFIVVGGDRKDLYSLTGTADYSLWKNVITRGEVRWDSASVRPYGVPADEKNLLTLALNVIYVF